MAANANFCTLNANAQISTGTFSHGNTLFSHIHQMRGEVRLELLHLPVVNGTGKHYRLLMNLVTDFQLVFMI